MDCTTEERPRKAGRQPTKIIVGGRETTVMEASVTLGITESGVWSRIIRGEIAKSPRYGLVKDVTDEPKRKPAPEPYAGPSREEVVAGQSRRLREPGSIIPVEEALDTAYTAGFAAGRASR